MDIWKPGIRQGWPGKLIKKYKPTRKWANDTVRYFTEGGALWSINIWKDS